jgi:DNA-binding beta-propeller fold protein YncE
MNHTVFIGLVFFSFTLAHAQEARTIASFQKAVAIAVNASLNECYVIEGGTNKILRLDSEGKVLANIGGFGVQREGFDSPRDLATDGMNVYIADRGNQRISHFDRFLNFIALLQNRPDASVQASETSGSLSSQVWRPTSVSASPQGDLFLIDEAQQQGLRINPFTFASTQQQRQNPIQFIFGGFNSGAGRLIEPNRLQATKSGKIFVSDEGARCLFVYDLFGNFVAEVGKGLLKTPVSLASGEVVQILPNGERKLNEWILTVDNDAVFIFDALQQNGFRFIGKLDKPAITALVGATAGKLMDVAVTASDLYLLTEKKLVAVPIASLKLEPL